MPGIFVSGVSGVSGREVSATSHSAFLHKVRCRVGDVVDHWGDVR
jgi:hypothetical protein